MNTQTFHLPLEFLNDNNYHLDSQAAIEFLSTQAGYLNKAMKSDPELLKTIEAMELIDAWIPKMLSQIEPDLAERFNNALLNIVVHRLVNEEGNDTAATILFRLAETVATGEVHSAEAPVELTRLDG